MRKDGLDEKVLEAINEGLADQSPLPAAIMLKYVSEENVHILNAIGHKVSPSYALFILNF